MRFINIVFIASLLFACKKKKNEEDPVADSNLKNGMVVLCEGLFQQNNSSVSWINSSTSVVTNDLFLQKTGRNLGDTGNDMQCYGGKVYIVVSVSSTIEVLNAATFSPIKQITMSAAGTSKQPRSIRFYGPNAYVSCFDGYVDVIDTASLIVTKRIAVGANPEGMAFANQKLYVANSGGLNFPIPDSTVSVIDLVSNTELYKITVGLNPSAVEADNNGDIYVIARGDYGAIPSRMKRIDSQTDQLIESFGFDVSSISKMNDKFLISFYDYATTSSKIGLFNTSSETMENNSFVDLSQVTTMYNIQYNSSNNRLYILDAMNYTNTGYVREFDSNGSYLKSFHVGLNPSKILFYD